MSDISDRLRAEARGLPATADPGLAGRVLARLPATMPAGQPPLRFPMWLAAAAGLAAAAAIAWLALARVPEAEPVQPLAVTPPAPPTLSELLGTAQVQSPATGEIAALRADLAAVAAAVRSAVPF